MRPNGTQLSTLALSGPYGLLESVEDQDLPAIVERLASEGVGLVGGPMGIPEIGQRAVFGTDNLGTVIELTEAPSRR